MKTRVLVLAALLGAACGGNKSTWQLRVKTPPGEDLFGMGVTQVRLTVGDQVQTNPVSSGRFDLAVTIQEPKQDQYVNLVLEALDAAGQVVARGKSPNVVLTVNSDSTAVTTVTVFVARVGKASATGVALLGDDMKTPQGRLDLAAAALRGRAVTPTPQTSLGVLITGGSDGTGMISARSWLYDPLSHTLLNAGNPATPRRGAVLVPTADANTGQQALLYGGQNQKGELVGTAELFDPAVASLDTVFSAPAAAAAPGAVSPTVVEVTSGVFLATGGRNKVDGDPLNQAVLLQRQPAAGSGAVLPGVKPLTGDKGAPPMAAARVGHSASPVTLNDGPGALIYGGTSDAQAPLAEVFSATSGTFKPLNPAMPAGPRRDHAAVTLNDGRVLLLGGRDDTGKVLRSALVLSVDGKVEPRDNYLLTARASATLARFGGEVLLCGGVSDTSDTPLASCEVFTLDQLTGGTAGRTEQLPRARVSPVLVPLETGNLLILGGWSGTLANRAAVADIDAYTSR